MLSVVVPTHNRPELCLRAVKSVAAVNLRTEIIVVDDSDYLRGDHTEQLVKELKLGNLQYHRIEPTTAEAAVNYGLHKADYPFATWLPDDDEWLPDFKVLLDAIKNRPEVGVIYGDSMILPDYALVPGRKHSGKIFKQLLLDNFIPGQATVFRRYLIGEGLQRHQLTEGLSDYELWLRLALRTQFLYVPQTVAVFHKTPGQKSEWSLETWGIAHIKLMQFILKTYPLADDEREAVEKRLKWAISYAFWTRYKWAGKIGRTVERLLAT